MKYLGVNRNIIWNRASRLIEYYALSLGKFQAHV